MKTTITYDSNYLAELLFRAAEFGATRALEQAGMMKNTITLAKIKKLHGEGIAKEARISPKITWVPIGKGGKTSGVYCSRIDFEKFLFNREFDFYKK